MRSLDSATRIWSVKGNNLLHPSWFIIFPAQRSFFAFKNCLQNIPRASFVLTQLGWEQFRVTRRVQPDSLVSSSLVSSGLPCEVNKHVSLRRMKRVPESSVSTVSRSRVFRGTCLSSPAAHVTHVTSVISVTMVTLMVYSLIQESILSII